MPVREIFERVLPCYGRKRNMKSETKRRKQLNLKNIAEVTMLGDTSNEIIERGQTPRVPEKTGYAGQGSHAPDASTIPKASKSSLAFNNLSKEGKDESATFSNSSQGVVPERPHFQLRSTLSNSNAGFKTKEVVEEDESRVDEENTAKSGDIVGLVGCPQNSGQLHCGENAENIKQSAPPSQYKYIDGYYDVLASEVRKKLSKSTEQELVTAVAEELAIEQTADELHMQELSSHGTKLNIAKYTPKISENNSFPHDVLEYLQTCGNFH